LTLARLAAAVLAAALLLPPSGAKAAEQLTLILDWFINPVHAPVIIAREKGFFRDVGLEVDVKVPADPNDPPKLVAAKQADIGGSYQPQLQLQVDEGLPVLRIGTAISTPLNSLVVLQDGPVKSLADLKGRKVGYSVGGFETAILGAMLGEAGLKIGDVELVNVNFSLSPALASGQVDGVIGAYRNFELFQLAMEGRPGRAFYPEEMGVPAFDEMIYITHRDNRDDPRLKSFLSAIERATLWLVNHPDEGWDVFKSTDRTLDDELNHRAWGATISRFSHSPAALDHGRYDRFARFLKDQGLIKEVRPLGTYAVDLFEVPQE
jgi:putative hydroxymethylpyrimidine transport system substrate-binding protein